MCGWHVTMNLSTTQFERNLMNTVFSDDMKPSRSAVKRGKAATNMYASRCMTPQKREKHTKRIINAQFEADESDVKMEKFLDEQIDITEMAAMQYQHDIEDQEREDAFEREMDSYNPYDDYFSDPHYYGD